MSIVVDRLTAERFALTHDDDRFELVAGELVEKPMSNRTVMIGGAIYVLLAAYGRKTGVARALPDGASYRCFIDDPEQVRKPDCSAFLVSRWSPRLLETTHIETAPDLIVEVISPNEMTYNREEKLVSFFAAGTREAWIVHPNTRQLERRFAAGTSRWYRAGETLDGAPLLPGFAMTLDDVLAVGD